MINLAVVIIEPNISQEENERNWKEVERVLKKIISTLSDEELNTIND